MKKNLLEPIISNTPICKDVYLLTFSSDYLASTSRPGQFIHIKCGYNQHQLLRRPLSIHALDREAKTVSLLYRVVGKGTAALTALKPGEKLDIIGPIGNTFLSEGFKKPLLIGGGLGVAPLKFLAQHLTAQGLTPSIVLGFSNAEQAQMATLFKPWADKVSICTIDGSLGYTGTSCAKAAELIQQIDYDVIYACGPTAMLNNLPAISGPCFVSLEAFMACGVGACLGCAVETSAGKYKHVCKDGPVFRREEVVLHE